jgi:hypothetical protein
MSFGQLGRTRRLTSLPASGPSGSVVKLALQPRTIVRPPRLQYGLPERAGRAMTGNRFRDEGVDTLYALWVIANHLLTVIGFLCAIWVVDLVIHTLWPGTEPVLFGKVPLKMIFETSEGGLIIAFLLFGFYRVARTLIKGA